MWIPISNIKYFILKNFILLIFSCIATYKCTTVKLSNDCFLSQRKQYVYHAFYIQNNDTITNEIIILNTTKKKYFNIEYKYSPQVSKILNLEDYFTGIKIQQKNIQFNEITNGICDSNVFYMHPPRQNQYYLLLRGAYPIMLKKLINDTAKFNFNIDFKIPLYGVMRHEYNVVYKNDTLLPNLNNSKIKFYEVISISKNLNLTNFAKKNMNVKDTESKMNGIYCNEYGYIAMVHSFCNNVKICIVLEKIINL